MSSTVSSIFSTVTISEQQKPTTNVNLFELFSSSALSSLRNNAILTSALNVCCRTALRTLHEHIEEVDEQSSSPSTIQLPRFTVNDDDFHVTVFPSRSYTPSLTTICQWRHDSFLNDKFLPLLFRLVATNMHSIVLNWTELELQHEEEREKKDNKKRDKLKRKLYELRAMEKSIKLARLYELSETSNEILMEQVDWKSVGTQMRSKGGYKYFDQHSLKRMWKHRCQYGVKKSWSANEDQKLNELVEQLGFGQWTEIAQNDIFQKNKKSPFMCAQRYMSRANQTYSERLFTQPEKDLILSMYKHRCSVLKDYRFSVSYAAYQLSDRTIRKITHIWTYISPDVQRGPFKPEEDTLLLRYAKHNAPTCWSILASTYLPDRSAVQCRQRYYHLIKPQPTVTKKSIKRKKGNKTEIDDAEVNTSTISTTTLNDLDVV